MSVKRALGVVLSIVTATCAVALAASSASAAQGPVWKILSVSNPTNLAPGDHTGDDALVLAATNVGGGSSDGSVIALSDSLPTGLTATAVYGNDSYKDPLAHTGGEGEGATGGMHCSTGPTPNCTTTEVIDPGDTLIMTIQVQVASELPPSLPVEATVSGGGAASESVSEPVTISSAAPEYGVAPSGLFAATSTTQAGAHPNVTTAFFLNTSVQTRATSNGIGPFFAGPIGNPKDVRFDLPPGLVGTTVGMPRCTMAAVIDEAHCPADTMIGTATVIAYNGSLGRIELTVPVFNIAPAPGEPAAFAFNAALFPARLDTSVLSNGDYAVRVSASDLTEGAEVMASWITIWGVPAEHAGAGPDLAARNLSAGNEARGGGFQAVDETAFGAAGVGQTRVPLLSNPSQCSTPLEATLSTDSWEAPGPGVFGSASTSLGSDTGCDLLSFDPSVSMLPDTLEAGAPAGYSFDLSVPQDTEAEGLATPDVKRTSVTLPLGTVISPSAADGLGDCTNEEFELHSGVPGHCPRDSQVGTVRIKTPALEERLNGEVYLASPLCDPCSPSDARDGQMIRLFAQVVGEGEDGVVVKLEGTGQINQQTGQVTTTFENTPQLPFSNFELTLQGGERATLANPRTCGAVATTVDLTPWSSPYTPDATPTSAFDVDENCFGPQFNPSFTAGTTSNQAGGFSPFTLAFGRSDSDEFLNGAQIQMPPGLLGTLSTVSLCPEPQASQGTCRPESLIGETSVETGPGADPFLVTGGKVYITGPYKGAPYGLSIVVPAKAGPYTLSGTTGAGTVVVRSAINVNPETAALTVTSDPLPTELDGIPLQLRLVNVTINRPGFIFNPTSCDKLAIDGTLTSTQAASATDSSSFQVTNCASLKFAPKFSASTSGNTSKANGASLTTKVSYPSAPQGTYADVAKVKVELPKALPSRLTTLQKACTAAQFDADPAGCPKESMIGFATVQTPVLPGGLSGPAIFVSHGSEAFPSLTIVLQGDGVTIDLVGTTFISKSGVTSTTFKSVPDSPFSSFELTLPEGKYSALGANGNLCSQPLVMPTQFVAQNGATLTQDTHIEVTDCPNSISVSSHSVSKKTLKLSVYVPTAGKLSASATGVSTATKTAAGRETVTVTVHQKKGGRLKTSVKLTFTPNKGKQQSKSVIASFAK
jgi:hypothetical protein